MTVHLGKTKAWAQKAQVGGRGSVLLTPANTWSFMSLGRLQGSFSTIYLMAPTSLLGN